MKKTESELIAQYESRRLDLEVIFQAFRKSRKIGFRLCQYQLTGDKKDIYAAIFCFSLIDNKISDLFVNEKSVKTDECVRAVIANCELLKSHIEFILSYSPSIEWNGGH